MENKGDRIGVGLAAYGMSGRVFHAPLLNAHSGFDLKKVLERNGVGRSRERYPAVQVVGNFEELLDDRNIGLVVINTPERTHFDLGRKALEAGKHVVMEKAFTVTSKEGEALASLAKEKRLMLSVFQNSRWHGDFITIRKVLNQGLLGEVREVEIHYDRFRNFIQPDSWKEEALPGTGSLYNLGVHIIDQVLVLFGWPWSLRADIAIQRPGGRVTDYFELAFYYDDLKVILKSSYLVREQGPRYTLHGSEGSFVKYGGDPQEGFLARGGSPLDPGYGLEEEASWGILNTSREGLHFKGKLETCQGSYMGYYDNIFAVLREGKELIVKPEHGIDTIRIIEAAIRSQEEQRTVVLDAGRPADNIGNSKTKEG